MKKITFVILFVLLFLVGTTTPTLASGLFDEYLYTSEWWPGESGDREIELSCIACEGVYVETEGIVFAPLISYRNRVKNNTFFIVDCIPFFPAVNMSYKIGSPNQYLGLGLAVIYFDGYFGPILLPLPRVNFGGRLSLGDNVKFVADTDFYTFILINFGKVELGLETEIGDIITLYGGVRTFFHFPGEEPLSDYAVELGGKLNLERLYLKGICDYNFQRENFSFSGEAGLDLGLFSLVGRVHHGFMDAYLVTGGVIMKL